MNAPLVQSESTLQPLGRSMILSLYAAAQSLRIYPLENATVQNTLEEVHKTVLKVLEREGTVDLRIVGDFLFLNDARMRLDLSDYAAFSYILGMFDRHSVGQVEFAMGIARSDLATFVSLLLQDAGSTDDPCSA